MGLVDFDSRFPGRDLATHATRCTSSLGETTLPAPGVLLGGPVAIARVDHGRWIADCPLEADNGAELVSPGRPFFCTECRNRSVGHSPIPVVFPDETARAQIDAYLTARVPANRNWHPEETVKDLQRENREYGVRLP